MSTYDETDHQYYLNNKERYAHYAAQQRDKVKAEMIAAYGGKCVICGIDKPTVLGLDHINDDAHVEKELFGLNARGGGKNYARLKAAGWPKDRFQLLCFNCNAEKEHNRRRNVMLESKEEFVPANRTIVQAKVGLRAHNTSGIKGVSWNTQKGKWSAKIMINYQQVYLGFYDNVRDAAAAYKYKAMEIWGGEANLQTDAEIESAAQALENQAAEPIAATASELGL